MSKTLKERVTMMKDQSDCNEERYYENQKMLDEIDMIRDQNGDHGRIWAEDPYIYTMMVAEEEGELVAFVIIRAAMDEVVIKREGSRVVIDFTETKELCTTFMDAFFIDYDELNMQAAQKWLAQKILEASRLETPMDAVLLLPEGPAKLLKKETEVI